MARRKKSKPDRSGADESPPAAPAPPANQAPAPPANQAPATAANQTPAAASLPSPTMVTILSCLLVVHLIAIFVSYSAIIEPSQTHSQLLAAATPYLRSTHFSADGRPFYLAHDTPDEQPHRLQYATRDAKDGSLVIDSQTQWTTIEPSGIAGLASWDRYARWMVLTSTLAQSDRPSLAAALLMPLVAADESIDAIRIIRLPTQLTTSEEDAAPPVYLARVIRTLDEIRLVSIGAKRLSTNQRQTDSNPGSADDNGAVDQATAAEANEQ